MPSSFPRRNLVVFRETGVIASSANFSSNKRSLRYQSSKTSRVFLKDVMELKQESQASTPPNLLNLNLFFPRRWRRPRSRLSPFSLPPRPGYLKVPNHIARMCSEWMTHAQNHASFTNWRWKKWRKTRRAILLFVLSTKTTKERFLLKRCQLNGT